MAKNSFSDPLQFTRPYKPGSSYKGILAFDDLPIDKNRIVGTNIAEDTLYFPLAYLDTVTNKLSTVKLNLSDGSYTILSKKYNTGSYTYKTSQCFLDDNDNLYFATYEGIVKLNTKTDQEEIVLANTAAVSSMCVYIDDNGTGHFLSWSGVVTITRNGVVTQTNLGAMANVIRFYYDDNRNFFAFASNQIIRITTSGTIDVITNLWLSLNSFTSSFTEINHNQTPNDNFLYVDQSKNIYLLGVFRAALVVYKINPETLETTKTNGIYTLLTAITLDSFVSHTDLVTNDGTFLFRYSYTENKVTKTAFGQLTIDYVTGEVTNITPRITYPKQTPPTYPLCGVSVSDTLIAYPSEGCLFYGKSLATSSVSVGSHIVLFDKDNDIICAVYVPNNQYIALNKSKYSSTPIALGMNGKTSDDHMMLTNIKNKTYTIQRDITGYSLCEISQKAPYLDFAVLHNNCGNIGFEDIDDSIYIFPYNNSETLKINKKSDTINIESIHTPDSTIQNIATSRLTSDISIYTGNNIVCYYRNKSIRLIKTKFKKIIS